MRSVLCVICLNDVVDANGGRGIVEIYATTNIADCSTTIDRRCSDESTDFGAAIRVDIVGPFQANVEILRI